MPRLRQAVLAARDLDGVVRTLRGELGLGKPFADELVAHFGLRNAVFAIGDTFLEVVSPVKEDTAAGRLLDRRGAACAGYMAMFQVDDVVAARERAAQAGVREVLQIDLDDIGESHLHPADVRGAIVSVSRPVPDSAWRWGGPGWAQRSVPGRVAGITVGAADAEAVRQRWDHLVGGLPEDVRFAPDPAEPGIVEVRLELEAGRSGPLELGAVRLAVA